MDATVLIHEATFDDSLVKEAIRRRHSTTGDAIRIGKRMNAKHLILTHFSQRYPKYSEGHENIVAFDGMIVRVGEMATVAQYGHAFKNLHFDAKEISEDTIQL